MNLSQVSGINRNLCVQVAGIHVTDSDARHRRPRLALAENLVDDVV